MCVYETLGVNKPKAGKMHYDLPAGNVFFMDVG